MALKPAAQRVEDLLAAQGMGGRVLEFPESTRSSAEAAAAIGCTLAQIAKSLVFKSASGRPVPTTCAIAPAMRSAAWRPSVIPKRQSC